MKNVIMFLLLLATCFIGGVVGKMLDPPVVQATASVIKPEIPTIHFPNFGKIDFSVDIESGKIKVAGENTLENVKVNVIHPPAIVEPVRIVYQQKIVEIPIRTYPKLKFRPLPVKNEGFYLGKPVYQIN